MLKTTRSLATLTVLVSLSFAPLFAPDASAASPCPTTEIVALGTPADGHARLCVNSRGLQASMDVRGLLPGDAYTVWWVYFDDPAACESAFECGLPDFAGDNPLAVFGRMDGAVIDGRGREMFSGRLRDFAPSPGSQVWLLVFGHGAADRLDNRHLARQLLTPEDPHAGIPHLGNEVDGPLGFPAAVAVFSIDETPEAAAPRRTAGVSFRTPRQ